VLVNRPFREGALLEALASLRLPAWAAEIDCTHWAQLVLKFIVAHPAVTCAIRRPARSNTCARTWQLRAAQAARSALRERIARAGPPPHETCKGGRLNMRQWWSTSEWWTYHPSDFLMFSPRIYWRLFESINAAYGPPAWTLVALALLWLALRTRRVHRDAGAARRCVRHAAAARAARRVLAVRRLGIPARAVRADQLAARYFAAAFVRRPRLLGALAASNGLRASTGTRSRPIAGLGLTLWALLGHPLLALAFGRPWRQGEVFGLAPDPTAIATLGLLLLVEAPEANSARRLLRVAAFVPIAWCAVSAATLRDAGLGAGVDRARSRDRRAAVPAVGAPPPFRGLRFVGSISSGCNCAPHPHLRRASGRRAQWWSSGG
jgi:hypothetical protein